MAVNQDLSDRHRSEKLLWQAQGEEECNVKYDN